VLRERIPALRLRAVRRALSDAVEAGKRRREDILRVATWRLDGGGAVDPDRMLAAAKQARLRWDLPLAERLARAAAEGRSGAGFEASLLIRDLAALDGRNEEAEAHFAGLEPTVVNDAQRSILTRLRMDNLVSRMGTPRAGGPTARSERGAHHRPDRP
jgi:hypothetical protein